MKEINTTDWRIIPDGFLYVVQKRTLQTKKTIFGKEKSYYTWETYYTGTYHDATVVFLKVTGLHKEIEFGPRRG